MRTVIVSQMYSDIPTDSAQMYKTKGALIV